MKKLRCPVCGTENREGVKYCRICFTRLLDTSHLTSHLKADFYSKVRTHKNFLVILFMFLLVLMWILLR